MTTTLIPAVADAVAGLPDALTIGLNLRFAVIGDGALAELVDVVAELCVDPNSDVIVLADTVKYTCRGRDLKLDIIAMLQQRWKVRSVPVLGEPRVHADEQTCDSVVDACSAADVIVVVGSGTMADLGKVAAARNGASLVIVQTATSVNGFADDQSVLLLDGAKRTKPSRWPDAVLADSAVLAEAPADLNLAGIGDLLSMFTAPADWLLATHVGMGDPFVPEIMDMIRKHGDTLLAIAPGVAERDQNALGELARLLTLSGISMGLAHCTAPSSGMEHVISHLLEMQFDARHEQAAWHGMQVGVSTLVANRLWEEVRIRLAEGDVPEIRIPHPDVAEGQVNRAFGHLGRRTADECWTAYSKKLKYLAANTGRLQTLLADWEALDAKLDHLLVPTATLVEALRPTPMPLRFAELGQAYDNDTVLWAVANGHRMRDRFNVADLADLLGLWADDDAARLMNGLSSIGVGL